MSELSLPKYAAENIYYSPMNYGEEIRTPEVFPWHETDLYILDFSFPAHVLSTLAVKYNSITLIDHHKTAIEQLTDANLGSNVNIILNSEYSGAYLAWRHFNPYEGVPLLIQYIQDRDLWKFSLPFSKEITSYIYSFPFTFVDYNRLSVTPLDEMKEHGATILRVNQRHCESIVAASTRKFNLIGHEGLVCNCPGQFASDVGNILAKRTGTFGATYYAAENGAHKFSLRSVGDFDVSKLAAEFGGGGHKNAAGFVLKPSLDIPEGIVLWNIEPPGV
jgi:oligoribonuclease NrnB/cAMP/cGMP phosphodiesterase (DHH superfamily)